VIIRRYISIQDSIDSDFNFELHADFKTGLISLSMKLKNRVNVGFYFTQREPVLKTTSKIIENMYIKQQFI